MKLLLADDDPMFCRLVQSILEPEYEIVTAADGRAAWNAFVGAVRPEIAVLNWMMPRIDGVELCRRIRDSESVTRTYVLLLTARSRIEDIVKGFEAGADDYIIKPFQSAEFRARVRVGARIVRLQTALTRRVAELEEALRQVATLRRLLPICSYCKRIRDDRDYWQELESYLAEHSNLEFTHGICPNCYEKHWKSELATQGGHSR